MAESERMKTLYGDKMSPPRKMLGIRDNTARKCVLAWAEVAP